MKIKQLRMMNGLSQSAFAKQLNIAQNTLSNYENGQRKPDPEIIKLIADKYKVTTDYLLDADQICDDRMGSALKSERKMQGLTLAEFSRETKIPQKDLEDYENNIEPINFYLFKILCAYFDKTPEAFYKDHEMYDEYIPEIFDGDVDKYEQFKKARDIDVANERIQKNACFVNSELGKVSHDNRFITLYRKYAQLPQDKQKIVDGVIDGFLPAKPKEDLPDDLSVK